MSTYVVLLILMISFLFFLFLGIPITFVLGGLGVIFGLAFWSPACFTKIATTTLLSMTDQILIAIPLWVFMGSMLERAGIGEAFYKVASYWMGRLRGGLAIGTIMALTPIAAMTPDGVGTMIMGRIAVPGMVSRGYDKRLAIGTVTAGGMLGMLIIPGILIIIYSMIAGESVGKMFAGAFIPGLLLSLLFAIQIGIRCYFNPKLGPPVTGEIRWGDKISSLRGVIFPAIIIVMIMGGIYSGICTPTEASSVGALAAIISAIINRNLNLRNLRDAAYDTLKICGMVFWLMIACKFFGSIFVALGAQEIIADFLTALPGSRWSAVIAMQLSLLILCCFIDDYPIMLLTAPIYVPIVRGLGFDTLWFGVTFVVNMNIAWLTPPYGFNLFYAKAIVPEMPMEDIYRGVLPFIACQLVLLVLVMVFPQLALWLPKLIA